MITQIMKIRLHRLQKQITQIILLVTSCWLLVTNCLAQPISSTDLINNARLYDGKTVVYAGEVIGDVMVRDDYAWLNVHDGNSAIGIWVNASLSKDIAYKGSYKSKGDWLEITGTFQRACPEHGGDLDIHGLSIKKISSGKDINERLVPGKKTLTVILFVILCLVWILKLLKRK